MGGIGEAISDLIESKKVFEVQLGKVKNLSITDSTCDIEPLNGGPTHIGCKLRSSINASADSKFVIYPKEESIVGYTIVNCDPNNVLVFAFSEIHKFTFSIGNDFLLDVSENGALTINSIKTVFNDGDNGGLVKSEDTAAAINSLVDSINELKTVLASWTPVAGDGGLAFKSLVATWAASAISNITANSLENSLVKH